MPKACFLRGTAFASGDAFLRAVAKGVCSSSVLQGDPERGELLLRLKETCDAGSKTNPVLRVVVVDEIDSLLKCGGEALRKVYGLATRETSTLALVGVANAIDVPRRAFFGDIPRNSEEASRHGTVVFRPYEHKQLVDIVKQRVGEGVFAAPALEFVARKVAAHSGDARRALDACRAALLSRGATVNIPCPWRARPRRSARAAARRTGLWPRWLRCRTTRTSLCAPL